MRRGFRSRSAVRVVSSSVRPSDRQRHSLRGRNDVRRAASLAHQRLALVHATIHLVVGTLGAVVKQHQPLDVRIEGEGDDVVFLENVQNSCTKVLKELKKAVILSGFSGGGYQYSNGVSVFFPWSREGYEVSKKNYESLWFVQDVKRQRVSWTDFLKKYLYEVSLRRCEKPEYEADAECTDGEKYRYRSGVRFDERVAVMAAGAGGYVQTKISGQEGTKISGQEGSKISGQEGSKISGQEGSKISGQEGSKISGQEGTKISGQEGSKISGQEGSKISGQEGSKLGGGGANAFFNSLRLFKNIESRWDISGFTKKPESKNA